MNRLFNRLLSYTAPRHTVVCSPSFFPTSPIRERPCHSLRCGSAHRSTISAFLFPSCYIFLILHICHRCATNQCQNRRLWYALSAEKNAASKGTGFANLTVVKYHRQQTIVLRTPQFCCPQLSFPNWLLPCNLFSAIIPSIFSSSVTLQTPSWGILYREGSLRYHQPSISSSASLCAGDPMFITNFHENNGKLTRAVTPLCIARGESPGLVRHWSRPAQQPQFISRLQALDTAYAP